MSGLRRRRKSWRWKLRHLDNADNLASLALTSRISREGSKRSLPSVLRMYYVRSPPPPPPPPSFLSHIWYKQPTRRRLVRFPFITSLYVVTGPKGKERWVMNRIFCPPPSFQSTFFVYSVMPTTPFTSLFLSRRALHSEYKAFHPKSPLFHFTRSSSMQLGISSS